MHSEKFSFLTTFLPPPRKILKQPVENPSFSRTWQARPFTTSTAANTSRSQQLLQHGYLPPITKQFGMTLGFIWTNMPMDATVPRPILESIDYLLPYLESYPEIADRVFHVSPPADRLRKLKEQANLGKYITFQDPHEAGMLLLTFLRELHEPVIPSSVYPAIVVFNKYAAEKKLRQLLVIIHELIPKRNLGVLQCVILFLSLVVKYSTEANKARDLADLFGTNLLWPENRNLTLQSIVFINAFILFLLQHCKDVFKEC